MAILQENTLNVTVEGPLKINALLLQKDIVPGVPHCAQDVQSQLFCRC